MYVSVDIDDTISATIGNLDEEDSALLESLTELSLLESGSFVESLQINFWLVIIKWSKLIIFVLSDN